MKISPVVSGNNAVAGMVGGGATASPQIRSVKMATNATPGAQVQELPPAVPIPDTNDKVEPVVEATQPLSPQFAALAKQRRALQVKERELQEKEKALTDRSAADSVSLARLKSEPLRVLLESGVTYDQLTQAILANQNSALPEVVALKDELKSLKEGFDKTLTERDAQAERQALAAMQREAIQLTQQGDQFELVRETKSIPDVMRLIEQTYRKTGEVLDVTEALQLVEEELIKDSLKLANLKKVQDKLSPPMPAQTARPKQQGVMRTLTNRDTASVPLSRKARALAAFNGTLKT